MISFKNIPRLLRRDCLFPVYKFRNYSLQSKLFELAKGQTCTSCGVKLQVLDSQAPGFIDSKVLNKEKVRFQKKSDAVFDQLYGGLSEEHRKLLNNGYESQSVEPKEDQDPLRVSCIRCHDALNHNKYFDVTKTPKSTIESILLSPSYLSVKNSAVIYHIVSASDFPHTLNLTSLLSVASTPSRLRFVINKSDLLFNHISFLDKFGVSYFVAILNLFIRSSFEVGNLKEMFEVTADQVILISASKGWNIGQLYNTIPEYKPVFFVGEANVGKSSIIKKLLSYDNKSASRGPAVFVLPGTTQDVLKYEIKNGKALINDLPGYSNDYSLYSLLKPSWIKHLSKAENEKLQKDHTKARQNYKNTKYVSITDRDCYSLGGLLFLVGPENSITQVRTNIHDKGYRFSNLSKAISVCNDPPDAMEPFIGIQPGNLQLENLQRYVIPPFYGSVDLVVKGLGYITITPTKSLKNKNTDSVQEDILALATNNLYELYAPIGIEFCIRDNIDGYLIKKTKTQEYRKVKVSKYVNNKINSTEKRGEVALGKSVKPVIDREKIYSQILKVPMQEPNINQWYMNNIVGEKSVELENKKDHRGKIKPQYRNLSRKDVDKNTFKSTVNQYYWKDVVK